MTKNIIVIATPRCGATAYSKYLSEQLNYAFINEPHNLGAEKLSKYFAEQNIPNGPLGGIIHENNSVIHTIVSQFVIWYNNSKFPDADYIFMERRDKWAQLKSYCILRQLSSKYGYQNINFKEPITITVSGYSIQMLLHQWIMYEDLKKKLPNSKVIVYEDIILPDNLYYKRTLGYENISITNIVELQRRYDHFIRKNS